MAALLDLYIKADVLDTLHKTAQLKEAKGVAITISVDDEVNQYNQNVSAYISQSKEEREAKKKRYYVGNGKALWASDSGVVVAPKTPAQQSQKETDDLPF
jgi:hypothetical protein